MEKSERGGNEREREERERAVVRGKNEGKGRKEGGRENWEEERARETERGYFGRWEGSAGNRVTVQGAARRWCLTVRCVYGIAIRLDRAQFYSPEHRIQSIGYNVQSTKNCRLDTSRYSRLISLLSYTDTILELDSTVSSRPLRRSPPASCNTVHPYTQTCTVSLASFPVGMQG